MAHLVLRDPQVASEKEVVANERRYRVDDDVEGAVSELLWSTAFKEHAYRWPTIGWMEDIQGFSTEDCRAFYETYYAPNNATIVVVGATHARPLLTGIARAYGGMPAATLPVEDVRPEPPQTAERRVEALKATTTDKLVLGYHGPAFGDFEHLSMSLLCEVLFGGRASRVHRRVVRELELALDVSAFVGPFRDPGLFEVYAVARAGHRAEELLSVVDEELARVTLESVTEAEIERSRARLTLGLLSGLETVDGKASTIGFYDTVLGRPAGAFERLEVVSTLGPSDLIRAARRFLRRERRSVLIVRPNPSDEIAS
jgi:zinc protease